MFDADRWEERGMGLFLEAFVSAISVPVKGDGSEHIDYVPTQVVSEYFAKAFQLEDETRLDGMLYPSSVAPGGKNLVLFPPSHDRVRSFSDVAEFKGK